MSYDPLTNITSLKEWAKIDSNTNIAGADDGLLTSLIAMASEAIGRYLGRGNLGAVYSYTENYFKKQTSGLLGGGGEFDLILRHWPVVSLSNVYMNGLNSVPILTGNSMLAGSAGVYLLEDGESEPRILKFRWLWRDYSVPIQVTYTAGYSAVGSGTGGPSIPMSLQQAANAYAVEIYRSQSWAGWKSKSLAGEVVTFDEGGDWGMSNRVEMMLKPHRDVCVFRGF